MAARRPHVVAHVAVSLDGASTGFEVDLGRYYELAAGFAEQVTLTGADTVLAQEAALAATPGPGPAPSGPRLAVVDGRGRVRAWSALRDAGYWSGVLALHCEQTPPRPRDRGVEELVTGTERVDLAAALHVLAERDGVERVRADSGGALIGALLRAGLLDEVSLLVHPAFGGDAPRWYGPTPPPSAVLDLVACERLDGGLVWLRHRVRS